MADIEKVIQGIEVCLQDDGCTPCPYYREGNDYFCGVTDIMRDALALLKEQEAEIDEISDEYLDLGNEIAKMPKAVLCKDCEYSYTEGFVHPHLICEKHQELGEVADDWFCADGWKA